MGTLQLFAIDRETVEPGQFALFCTKCDARCYGYAIAPGWEDDNCVFCGGVLEGLRVIGAKGE